MVKGFIMSIKVLLVDDHKIVREGVRALDPRYASRLGSQVAAAVGAKGGGGHVVTVLR